MRHKKTPTNKVTHPGLLTLKDGVVWVGCPDPDCKKEIAIKKCKKHEFTTQSALSKEFPSVIPKVYDGVQCPDGFFMYSEYLKDGSLKKCGGDPKLEQYVYKVFLALKLIHDKHPSFRHNDLHVDNVLMRGDQPLLYDFEFANWNGNPMFDSVFKRDYGMYTGNHPMYDFHFFVNSIVAEFPAKFRIKALSVFPSEYIGPNSSVVKNWRLRSDVSHKNLPTMDQVLRVFSLRNTKMRRPKVLTFSDTKEKKTTAKRSPPKRTGGGVKFTVTNKERARNRKAELVRQGMNEINAELKAIRNIETLKIAGLLTPTPSPKRRIVPPSPVKRAFARAATATGPSMPVPVVAFTTTPRRRPKIDKKLCTSYKKDELMRILKRLGHRVDARMTLREMCSKLSAPTARTTVYKRPVGNSAIDVRKKTYEKHLKANLYRLAKNVGVTGVTTKSKKGEIVNKIRTKLNKNVEKALSTLNKSTVTTRQLSEKLAKNYGWANNRRVERVRLLKIYRNKV
jgi:hypothetical protein